MSKYMRSRRVPFEKEEPKALDEEFDLFLDNVEEAGAMLRSLRKERGWSLSELARAAGLDKHHLVEMEEGLQPIPEQLAKRFSQIFHTSKQDFR